MKYLILLFAALYIFGYVNSECVFTGVDPKVIIPRGQSYKVPLYPEKKQCYQLHCVDDGKDGWLEHELCTFPWIKCKNLKTEMVQDYDYSVGYPECCPKMKCADE